MDTKPTSIDYVERVNLAIDYILQNLDQPIRLDRVAAVACFSPFHFHRIFRSLVGETLRQFVRRLRLERALRMMNHRPNLSLTDIGLACGFSSSSDFARSFKQRFGVPPSAFDIKTYRDQNRDKLIESASPSGHRLERLPVGENPDGFTVTLRDVPARTVAYIRVARPFEGVPVMEAATRLVTWATSRGLEHGQWLGYMWDDPETVALEDCRYDVGVVVPDVTPRGEIGRFDFPPMLVADVEIHGEIDLEQRAIDWIWGTWLPQSGYVPTDLPSFEAWQGLPFAHGESYYELNLQLPVERP